MKRFALVFAALTLSITVFSPLASAQTSSPTAKGPGQPASPDADISAVSRPSAAFLKLQDSSKGKFEQIQSVLSGIETGKVIHDGDNQKLDKAMFDYANELKAAFDLATKEADDASKSKGRQGSTQSLRVFEDMAQQHEQVASRFESRVSTIESKMKTGEIKPERALLQKMTPSEMKEYRQFLTPSGLKEMERAHPDLMKANAQSSLDRPEKLQQQLIAQAIPIPLPDRIDTLFANLIDDLGPRSAEASLAAPCVGPCYQKNWGACAACIATKVPAAVSAWNTFVGCWNGAGTCDWRHWGNCVRKAACLAVLIGKLA